MRPAVPSLTAAGSSADTVAHPHEPRSELLPFRDALRKKDFVVSAEIPLLAEQSVADVERIIAMLAPHVDAVQVGDNDTAEGHIAPLAVARIALDHGVDAVMHLSARDRNRIALQSDILGAAALGVTSFVFRRGEKLPASLKGRVKGVFDTSTTQLLRMASRIRDHGRITGSTGLLLGSSVTVIRPGKNWDGGRIAAKIDAGAALLQTRPCLNVAKLGRYFERLVALRLTHRATFVAGVPLLTSAAEAQSLSERLRRRAIPPRIPERLEAAADPRGEGIRILSEVIGMLASTPGIAGVNISYAGDTEAIVEALAAVGSVSR